MKKHIDLFAGIGGFSYAFDQVFYEEKNHHIFVENDPFCTAVLKKHWPEAEYHGDIRKFVADARSEEQRGLSGVERKTVSPSGEIHLLTGGFPCQPFSHAGQRKGTEDDRYLWPPMLESITLFKPRWIIVENVPGLVTWNDGLVFETVCSDLEKEGYEVQPFIISACAVGAPHRRDRVWIVAHASGKRAGSQSGTTTNKEGRTGKSGRASLRQTHRTLGTGGFNTANKNATDSEGERDRGRGSKKRGVQWEGVQQKKQRRSSSRRKGERCIVQWNRNWQEVALATCHDRMDDGFPRWMDGVAISATRHRRERIKACGNAIVPQVAMKIMQAIKQEQLF